MRRVLALVTVLAVFLLAACGGSKPSGTGSQASGQTVTIRFIGSSNPENFRFEELQKLFEEQNPDIKVEYLYTPDRAEDKLKAMMSAGDAPDIARVNDDYVVAYAVRDLARPMDDLIAKYGPQKDSSYYPSFWDWAKVNGKHYSWTIGYANRAMFVNVDLFEQHGVPLPPKKWEDPSWNWDALVATAKKLTIDTNGDGKPEIWGVSIFNDTGAEETFTISNGGTGIYAKGGRTFTLGEGKNLEAMQWLQELATVHKVHPLKSEFTQQKADDMFAAGKIAMIFLDARLSYTLNKKIGDKFRWAIRSVPMSQKGVVEGSLDTYIIPKNAKYPDQAFQFLKFLTEEPAQKIMAEAGYIAPVKHEWTAKYFGAKGQMPMDANVLVEGMTKYWVSVAKATNVELARGIYRRELDKAWNGEEPMADVLKRVTPEVNQLLKEFPDVQF